MAILLLALACTDQTQIPTLQVREQEEARVLETGVEGSKVRAEIVTGTNRGQVVLADRFDEVAPLKFGAGDTIVLQAAGTPTSRQWIVVDVVRRNALYLLAGLFALAVGVIGGWRGIASLVGIFISFVVLVAYMVPFILAGSNPVLVSLIGGSVIVAVTLYLAHGFSAKTTVALVSTTLSLVLSVLLALVFTGAAHLSGVSEEALTVSLSLPGVHLNLEGLLLAGIIIGVLGVLDDVTVGQASIVFALQHANPELGRWELFTRAMSVGRDHISSLVNTLVLVYAGAALPTLLLFTTANQPFLSVLNREIVAIEVVRTLVGSIGLIAAVPITTAIAIRFRVPVDAEDAAHLH